MKYIIRNCPYHSIETPFPLDGGRLPGIVNLLSRQPVVQVSLTATPNPPWFPATTSFPAVVDTGFNGNFVLTTYHLKEWAKLNVINLGLPLPQPVEVRGRPARVYPSHVWLRPNKPGTWETNTSSPVRLDCIDGIFLMPDEPQDLYELPPNLRLPIIGIKALESPKLKLAVDGAKRRFSIRRLTYLEQFLLKYQK